jgi:hypothetical protein
LNFSCQQGSHQLKIYCQILIFVFLNLLNQFLVILWVFQHPFLALIIFWIHSEYLFLYVFFVWEPKNE